ncbi:MAG: hypothetical protein ABR511_02485 [Acidimicrobiales bacterium]
MRALAEGRHAAARAGLDAILAVGREAGDPGTDEAWWALRHRVALASGDEDERYEVLDHCRQRAWVHGDLAWRGRLALLLARLGRTDEAGREVEACAAACLAVAPAGRDRAWLDATTDVAEAAAALGATAPAGRLADALAVVPDGNVVLAGTEAAKGPLSRYLSLVAGAGAPLARAG